MSTLRFLTALSFGLLWFGPVQAQHTVRGTITDAASGEVLPAATVQVEGTLRGTITNSDGAYELRLNTLPATLVVRYIGYESHRVPISADAEQYDVALHPVTYSLETVVVTDEDPALNIMRKVIEQKQRWRAALETWKAEAYNRFTYENDTGIVAIAESISEAFWDRERGLREVAKGTRKTANLDFEDLLPAAIFMQNLYDDDIELAGYTFVGPTHPDALKQYHFKLEGYRYRDDELVYDISLTPKSKLQSAFIGKVAVLDDAYALLEVELVPNESFMFPVPIQGFEITYQQQFSNFGQNFWLPVDFRSRGTIKIGMAGLQLPPITFNQVTQLSDYTVNAPLPDSLYAKDDILTVDSAAVKADTAFAARDLVPLSARESVAYDTIDSTHTLEKAYKPTGFLARFIDTEEDSDGVSAEAGSGGLGINLDLQPKFWFNRVDGAHWGGRVTVPVGEYVRVYGEGGYATGSDRWSYGAGTRVRWGPRKRGHVSLSYRDNTDSRATVTDGDLTRASLLPLIGDTDHFDYYRNARTRAEIGYRIRRINTVLTMGFQHEDHTSLAKTTDYDLFANDFVQRLNPPIQEGTLRALTFGVDIGDEFVPVAGNRRASLFVEHALEGFSGDFAFTRFSGVLDWRVNTFFTRRLIPNTLDLRLIGFTSTGDLPLQRFGFLSARTIGFTNFGTFKSLDERPYEGQHHLALFWEHNFRTLPFEILGLRSLAEKGIYLSIHGGHGRTWIDADRLTEIQGVFEPMYQDRLHHEIGLSVHNLFGFPIRLDLTQRLDKKGFFVGFGAARVF